MPSDSSLVTNAGPLISLIVATDGLGPLRGVMPHVIVPFEVQREILAGGRSGFAVQQFLAEEWLDSRRDNTVVPSFLSNAIDPGEAAVISLALSESISVVCLDDLEARRVARLSGLRVTGSLGILIVTWVVKGARTVLSGQGSDATLLSGGAPKNGPALVAYWRLIN